jgi:hypothetical protein
MPVRTELGMLPTIHNRYSLYDMCNEDCDDYHIPCWRPPVDLYHMYVIIITVIFACHRRASAVTMRLSGKARETRLGAVTLPCATLSSLLSFQLPGPTVSPVESPPTFKRGRGLLHTALAENSERRWSSPTGVYSSTTRASEPNPRHL